MSARLKKLLRESNLLTDYLGINNQLAEKLFHDGLSLYSNEEFSELPVLLGCLQGLATLHQTHHWQSKGLSYYGDHLLFQRLYEGTGGQIDALAEKIVGVSHRKYVGYFNQLIHIKNFLLDLREQYPVEDNQDKFAMRSLLAELCFIELGELVMDKLESEGNMSRGLEQALGNILDTHEGYVYLLKERLI